MEVVRMEESTPLLELVQVQALHKNHRGSAPLYAGVNLLLAHKECVAVVAPSGFGKSSLLRQIAGLDELPHPSVVRLCGHDQHEWLPTDWRARVLLVSQSTPLRPCGSPSTTLRDALLPLKAQRSWQRECASSLGIPNPSANVEACAARFADRWGMASRWDAPWSTLSGGEIQRARLAIALALNPLVLLLDEPCAALDASTAILVERDIKDSSCAVVVVSHSPEQVARFATKVLHLNHYDIA